MKRIYIFSFALVLILFCLIEVGTKYKFNPHTTEFLNEDFIGLRFSDFEFKSTQTYKGPSWLTDILKREGFDRFENKDYWILYGKRNNYFVSTRHNFNIDNNLSELLDVKGRTHGIFMRLIKAKKTKEAFDHYEARLTEFKGKR